MVNVGDATITVTADARAFATRLKAQTKAIAESASKQGAAIGKRLGESLNKAAAKPASRLGTVLGAGLAVLPLVTSGLSAIAGAATALVSSMAQASFSAAAVVGVYGSLAIAAGVAKIAFNGFAKAVGGDADALAALSPAARASAEAVSGLEGAWKKVTATVQQNVFRGLAGPISQLSSTMLPMLQGALGRMGAQVNLLFKDLLGFANSTQGVNAFRGAIDGSTRVFAKLRGAAVPLLNGILNLYNALLPAAGRLADRIRQVAQGFDGWTQGVGFAERVDKFMIKAERSAGLLWTVLKNVGASLKNIFTASAGSGDGLMKMLGDVTGRFADFTGSVEGQASIKKWADQGVAAMGSLGRILGSMGGLFSAMFNPALFNGFLGIIESITPTIKTVFGVVQSALLPAIEKIGGALAENGPKIAKLFVALAPVLKGVGAIIGEIVSQALDLVGTVASVITPIVGAISKFLGPILVKLAPVIGAIVVAFGGFGAKLVSLIPVVGRFLAPIVKLAGYLLSKIGPALSFAGKLFGTVFRGISAVVGPVISFVMRIVGTGFRFIGKIIGTVVKAIGIVVRTYFTIIRTVITTVLNVVRAIVTRVWTGIRVVVSAVVRVVSRVVGNAFQNIRSVVTSVMNTVRSVISRVWNAIKSTVTSVVNGVRNAVSKGFNTIKRVVGDVMGSLRGLASKGINAMKSAVTSGLTTVVNFVKGVPRRVLALAGSFLNAGRTVGGKVIGGIMDGLRAAGGYVSNLAGSIKSAINGALNLPFTIRGPGPLPDFTIPAFARGTNNAPGGLALVGERGPELVNLPKGSQVKTAAQTRAMARDPERSELPRKVVLSIGGREFIAFVQEIADGRITANDSLARQAG